MRNPYPLQWPVEIGRTAPADREIARFRVTLAEAIDDLLAELSLMDAANVVITSDLPTRHDGLPYSSGRADDPGIGVWCVVDGKERVFACDRWTTPAANLRAIGKTIEAIRGLARWGSADMVTRALGGFAALPSGSPTGDPSDREPSEFECRTCLGNGRIRDGETNELRRCLDCGGDGGRAQPNPGVAPAPRCWREVLGLEGSMQSLGPSSSLGYRRRAFAIARSAYRALIRQAHPDVGGSEARAAELNLAIESAKREIGI